MKHNRKPTKGEQIRVNACEHVVNWASENREDRGCILLATDGKSSTCAVIGQSKNLVAALASAIRTTPNLRSILSTALMFDLVADDSENDSDK